MMRAMLRIRSKLGESALGRNWLGLLGGGSEEATVMDGA
jgi:hypothetical protein